MSLNSTDSSDISNSNIFPYGGCPVENITGVWRFQRPPLYKDATSSIPGHLLHYIISGSYKVSIGKKQYYPKKGDILYYYGSEQVVWIGDNSYVGANAVVLRDVDPNSTIVGVPGRITKQDGKKIETELDHIHVFDPVMQKINELQKKVEELEGRD